MVTGSEVFLGGASMIGIEEDVTPLHDEEDVDNLMTALEYEFLENEALLNAFHNNLNVTLPAPGYW
ncbi:hypothetical protein D3C73_1608990 [compost metagenome]